MRLQLALDCITIEDALSLLEELDGLIDIVEIGTPFIMEYGMEPVRQIRKRFPEVTLLADCKIADGAKIEAKSAFDAGADIVTVLALSEAQTIIDTVSVAKAYGKEVLVDLLAVTDIPAVAKRVEGYGADYLCVHNAFDLRDRGINPLHELLQLQQHITQSRTAVAGGITLQTIGEIAAAAPDILIVGGGITQQKDKRETVLQMKKIMENAHER